MTVAVVAEARALVRASVGGRVGERRAHQYHALPPFFLPRVFPPPPSPPRTENIYGMLAEDMKLVVEVEDGEINERRPEKISIAVAKELILAVAAEHSGYARWRRLSDKLKAVYTDRKDMCGDEGAIKALIICGFPKDAQNAYEDEVPPKSKHDTEEVKTRRAAHMMALNKMRSLYNRVLDYSYPIPKAKAVKAAKDEGGGGGGGGGGASAAAAAAASELLPRVPPPPFTTNTNPANRLRDAQRHHGRGGRRGDRAPHKEPARGAYGLRVLAHLRQAGQPHPERRLDGQEARGGRCGGCRGRRRWRRRRLQHARGRRGGGGGGRRR